MQKGEGKVEWKNSVRVRQRGRVRIGEEGAKGGNGIEERKKIGGGGLLYCLTYIGGSDAPASV